MKQSTNAVSQSAKSKGQNSRKEISSKNLLKYIQTVHNRTIEYFRDNNIDTSMYFFSNNLIEEYDKHLTEEQQKTFIQIYNYIKDLEKSMDRLRYKQYQESKVDTTNVHPSELNEHETKQDIAKQQAHLDEIQTTTPDKDYVIHIKYLSGKDYIETLDDNIKALNRFKHLVDSSDQIDIATLETPQAVLDQDDIANYVVKEA